MTDTNTGTILDKIKAYKPEEIAAEERSHTGRYLRSHL